MRAVVVALCFLVAGCRVETSYDGTTYGCDDGVCPAGFACVAAQCVRGDVVQPDAANATPDARTPDAEPPPAPPPDAEPPAPDAAPPPPEPDAAPPPCEGGDAHVVDLATGSCYVYVAAAETWATAGSTCASLLGPGAHLVVITSAAENALVAPLPGAGVADVWTGGTDAAAEGTFVWVTGDAFTYTNWRTGEPNDSATGGEDCSILEVDNGGTWDDRNCGNSYPFVCER